MATAMTQLGGGAFNHHSSADSEREYDRLRGLAREEAGKRSSCMARSQQAYQAGDGASAHALSEEGKRHGAMVDQFNQQASEYIFRENNSMDRVAADTIDLHGQFVEEAERILEQRIRYAKSTGQHHLHVIVGKGNHSPGHIQKIKPRVEQICRQEGLQFATEENAGRIFINLQGGTAIMPDELKTHHNSGYAQNYGGRPYSEHHLQQHQQAYGQQPNYQQPSYANQYPYPQAQAHTQTPYPQQSQYPQQETGEPRRDKYAGIKAQIKKNLPMAKKYAPRVIREIKKHVCVVM